MKALYPALLLLALLLLPAGCLGEEDLLAPFQGTWTDVNSSSVLTVTGDALSLCLWGSEPMRFTVTVDPHSPRELLQSDGTQGFFILNGLTLSADGRQLSAREQVLDARSREFLFVRQEDLSDALAVKDLSEDLPKEIRSRKLQRFSLSFSLDRDHRYSFPDAWPDGQYSLTLERQESGGYTCRLRAICGDMLGPRYDGKAPWLFPWRLQRLLRRMKLAELNGYHMVNSADVDGFSLYAEYASGEVLSVRSEGDPAKDCPFDLARLAGFFGGLLKIGD